MVDVCIWHRHLAREFDRQIHLDHFYHTNKNHICVNHQILQYVFLSPSSTRGYKCQRTGDYAWSNIHITESIFYWSRRILFLEVDSSAIVCNSHRSFYTEHWYLYKNESYFASSIDCCKSDLQIGLVSYGIKSGRQSVDWNRFPRSG